ncbi:MAG: hypothetical protein NTW28_06410 [Candidatus Solibacter sp.]|nr:hypothetical protein [Candidatus Solibacter sp.]
MNVTLAESMDNEKSDRRRLAELAISERVFKKSLTWLGILASPFLISFGIAGFQLNNFVQNTKEQVDIKTKAAIGQIKSAEDYARSSIDVLACRIWRLGLFLPLSARQQISHLCGGGVLHVEQHSALSRPVAAYHTWIAMI